MKLLRFAIITCLLLVCVKVFAFECDWYWKDGQCYLQDWYYSFPMVKQCRQETFWRDDTDTKNTIDNEIKDLEDKIVEVRKILADLESQKNNALSRYVSVPVIYYRKDICFDIEKPLFHKLVKSVVLPATGVQW